MRIGIIYPAPDSVSAANWSGIPNGLASGLLAHGVEVVPINDIVAHGLREAVMVLARSTGRRGDVAARMRISRWARTRALAQQVSQALPLDAVVAMAAEMYDLAEVLQARVPGVTFDDATITQQLRNPDSDQSQAKASPKHMARSVFYQRAGSEAAAVCCVSTQWAARSFEEDYGIPADKIAVVGMGHRPRLTRACGERDWSAPKFLFVGADWRRKNGAAVLMAFERVRQQIPAASLDVVGAHPAISMPGVTTHGFLAREDGSAQRLLDRLYATATCFVAPSLFDAAGIAYLEAASSGLAVVVTARGGATEMLNDGAVVVDPYDPSAIFEAMFALSDPGYARSMGAKALRNAASSSWSDVGGHLLEALASARLQRLAG